MSKNSFARNATCAKWKAAISKSIKIVIGWKTENAKPNDIFRAYVIRNKFLQSLKPTKEL